MDEQVKAGSLLRTITESEISEFVGKIVGQLQSQLTSVIAGFLSEGISAAGMHKLENQLERSTKYILPGVPDSMGKEKAAWRRNNWGQVST